MFWLLLLYYCYLPHTSLNQTSSMMGGYVHFDILARPSTDFNSNYIILEFHVQLRFIELKMNYRLVVEIGGGCLCRWADLLCTIASWCQQRNFIFILCTFVLHWLSNLNHTKIIYLMCSHICLYIGRFFLTWYFIILAHTKEQNWTSSAIDQITFQTINTHFYSYLRTY